MAKDSNLELVQKSVMATSRAIFGAPSAGDSGDHSPGAKDAPPVPPADWTTAYAQSLAKAVQSIGQTTAIVIQDAGDMLRNISTVETTAIGAATAAWIATKDEKYKDIITESMTIINGAADAYLKIGQNAYAVFSQFKT